MRFSNHYLVFCLLSGLLAVTSLSCSASPRLMNSRFQSASQSVCQVQTAQEPLQDAVFQVLQSGAKCPTNVFEFRQLLQAKGAQIQSTMVANRGFHNHAEGSFSFFEMVTGPIQNVNFTLSQGQLFFGHFTGVDGNRLIALQSPEAGNLMIELIAWDPAKRLYNFYELIGNGQIGQWFYRGDSQDIRADLKQLHRQSKPAQPQFGRHLRCSGCHLNGGPIMKELAQPHNDWWQAQRPLPFGQYQPDPQVLAWLKSLQNADVLAQQVQAGNQLLQNSQAYQHGTDLQESLRPLFCVQEVNFESDQQALEQSGSEMNLPAGLLVDPRLAQAELKASTAYYQQALNTLGSRFPEIQRQDADHGWLGPVKASSDQVAIQVLLQQGLIDAEFVADVLAVDMTNPVFSAARCGLLHAVPRQLNPQWRQQFQANLQQMIPTDRSGAAQQAWQNLQISNLPEHQARAQAFLNACQTNLRSPEGTRDLLVWLGFQRQVMGQSEISKNPLGQILEPGFRVIFPLMQLPAKKLSLNSACKLDLAN